ncbi:Serine/threonine-protein kinase 17B [Hondaea fermentalgiana]|uniref:Serine/threonine-protein kinase 17B n=1 Tax=Hondaea fermentalgiana TaxID=2315210 RepID=A0A2R5FCX3_9STRA|nr:Serine/threonine-protein kinase 17B [Hondaea fermentalgiana]|eukprot:GBG16072.1 Serine/threonine-protein kinase 17B [Hondaea fermentalgiana]
MQDALQGCISMPFYKGGDLDAWIRDNPFADLATRRRIAIGLLYGLHVCTREMHDVTMTQPLQTTKQYMAPELLRDEVVDKVESAVDMFSVGVVLAKLFENTEISEATKSLISSLRSEDPSQRPTALEALHHEAFQVEPVKEASCAICLDI